MKEIKQTKNMPNWAKYVAMDKNGEIYCYEKVEIINIDNTPHFNNKSTNKTATEIFIKPYCKDWRKSLRKIVDKQKKSKRIKQQAKEIESKSTYIKNLKAAFKDKCHKVMRERDELKNWLDDKDQEISDIKKTVPPLKNEIKELKLQAKEIESLLDIIARKDRLLKLKEKFSEKYCMEETIKHQDSIIDEQKKTIEIKSKTIQNLLQVIGAYEDGEMK